MVRRYRKKPVTIEAIQYDGSNYNEVSDFVGNDVVAAHNGQLIVKTLEGELVAPIGDFIIRGVKGEFYPCKPDIFMMTYDVDTPPEDLWFTSDNGATI